MDASKPWAVVTGASSGIGFVLAERLARHDDDLLLPRMADRLKTRTHRKMAQPKPGP